jgi:hypothetical protein
MSSAASTGIPRKTITQIMRVGRRHALLHRARGLVPGGAATGQQWARPMPSGRLRSTSSPRWTPPALGFAIPPLLLLRATRIVE